MIILSHEGKCYPMDDNIYDFYLSGIIGGSDKKRWNKSDNYNGSYKTN